MEKESWRTNPREDIVEEESWRLNHGDGVPEQESWKKNRGGGIMGKHPGRIQEAPMSGKKGYQEAPMRQPGCTRWHPGAQGRLGG